MTNKPNKIEEIREKNKKESEERKEKLRKGKQEIRAIKVGKYYVFRNWTIKKEQEILGKAKRIAIDAGVIVSLIAYRAAIDVI